MTLWTFPSASSMKLGCSTRVDDWNKMNEWGTRGMDTIINIEYPFLPRTKPWEPARRKVPPTYFGKISAETPDGMRSFHCCITNIRKSTSSAHDILVCLRRCNLEGLRSQPRGTHLFWFVAWVIGSLQFYGCYASSCLCEIVLSAYAC
jgi:hypothetical protein